METHPLFFLLENRTATVISSQIIILFDLGNHLFAQKSSSPFFKFYSTMITIWNNFPFSFTIYSINIFFSNESQFIIERLFVKSIYPIS